MCCDGEAVGEGVGVFPLPTTAPPHETNRSIAMIVAHPRLTFTLCVFVLYHCQIPRLFTLLFIDGYGCCLCCLFIIPSPSPMPCKNKKVCEKIEQLSGKDRPDGRVKRLQFG